MKWLKRMQKELLSQRGAIYALILISLILLIPAIVQLNKDTAEVYKASTEDNKRKFDVSLERVKAITTGIGTIATIAAGVVLYLNFKVANRNAEIAEDKQVTERFSKAVEQLGNKEQLQVRLGGIYSLERIAKDSPEDLWTIVEVLSAFIREYASTPTNNRNNLSLFEVTLQSQTPRPKELIKLPTDIQASLTVIDRVYKQRSKSYRIDLREAEFSNTRLVALNLNYANLSDADLSSADLGFTDLSFARLKRANFSSAKLDHANLNRANLSESKLGGASFANADLSFANLSRVDFVDANLSYANLSFTSLLGVNLSGARLSGAKLNSTRLIRANLSGVDLRGADLIDVDLRGADLIDVDLRGANLSDTRFSRSVLLAADLRSTKNLEITQLTGDGQPFLCNVALPDTLTDIDSKIQFRDCDQFPLLLAGKILGGQKLSLESANKLVEKLKQKKWG